ncbi:hypothetical protein [Sphingobium sp. RAC03]|uniref:hypothetical protein n=1 Tax=Sphingobium sp. RAC03 TaxID=1843368 RepID=UPI00083DCE0B|nr:hypothetical protein [Sphingobium sp. RAC03]AOF96238.1 hypothetical protein BSY17_246 [Sphingobium sp. RAC03]
MMDGLKDEYNEASAASYLGISGRTLRRYRMMGRIGHHRSPGGRISYTLDQLIDFQLSTRVAPALGDVAAA